MASFMLVVVIVGFIFILSQSSHKRAATAAEHKKRKNENYNDDCPVHRLLFLKEVEGFKLPLFLTSTVYYNFCLFNLSAFQTTETELKAIAALAMIGLRSNPKNGYKMPAAIGTPKVL